MIEDRAIGKYLSVWLCIGVVFSTYSFVLDLIFHPYGYDKKEEYIGSMGEYLLAYLVFFNISLPIALFYNLLVNHLLRKTIVRIIFGVSVGAAGGALFAIPSNYIGKDEKLKGVIVMALVGLTVEIIRILVVRRRERKKHELNENSL